MHSLRRCFAPTHAPTCDGCVARYDVLASRYDVSASRYDVLASRYDVSASRYDVSASRYDVSASRYDVSAFRYDVSASRYDVLAAPCDGARPADGVSTSPVGAKHRCQHVRRYHEQPQAMLRPYIRPRYDVSASRYDICAPRIRRIHSICGVSTSPVGAKLTCLPGSSLV